MTNLERYLEHADRCRVLADRYGGTLTARTLEQAAVSWMLLASLERGGGEGKRPVSAIHPTP